MPNLNDLALRYIESEKKVGRSIKFYRSASESGVVLFPQGDDKEIFYGNFHKESIEKILKNSAYKSRLFKAHTHRKNFEYPYNLSACELDSCSSSDALLMNIFCHPEVQERQKSNKLQVKNVFFSGSGIQFGVIHKLQKQNNKFESRPTEIDMVIGSHIFESKLSEEPIPKQFLTKADKRLQKGNHSNSTIFFPT